MNEYNPYVQEEFSDTGTPQALRTLASGMAAQVPGGAAGLVNYFRSLGHSAALKKPLREALDAARERGGNTVRDVSEKFTMMPRTAEGAESLQGFGEGIERAGEYAMRVPGVAPTVRGFQDFSASQPLLAAGLMAAGEVAGPGKGKPKLGAAKAAAEAAALRRAAPEASGGLTVESLERTLAGLQDQVTRYERQGEYHLARQTQRSVAEVAADLRQMQRETPPPPQAVQPQGLHPLYVQRIAHERGLSYDEALRALREEDAGQPQRIEQVFGDDLRQAAQSDPAVAEQLPPRTQFTLEAQQQAAKAVALRERSQALRSQKELPGVDELEIPDNPAQLYLPGMERTPEELLQKQQAMKTRLALKRQAEADYKANPDKMDRDAVVQFINAARENPDALQYGLAPPPNVSGIEEMAKHFGRKAGQRIDVDIDTRYGESDEPYKIKVEKEHGRGEVMRDRHGEYKLAEAEEGQIKYDDRGNPVMKEKEVELHGPLPEGEEGPLMGTKEVKKKVEEGNYYMDEDGNYVYRKSEGGEPVRDERGRQKYTEEENPDYSEGEEGETWKLRAGGGPLIAQIAEGAPMSVDATEIGIGGGGSLLYQTLLADASRSGYRIGSAGLTDDNALRMLSNTLSNYVRMGRNPRDLGGTGSGKASRARGYAEGPEIWRAEAELTKSRLNRYGSNARDVRDLADSVRFDGEQFLVDGQPTEPKQLLRALDWGEDQIEETNVGQKTIMRMALFDWLRGAKPDEAATLAKDWKKWGPLFGIGSAATALGSAMSAQEENEAKQ